MRTKTITRSLLWLGGAAVLAYLGTLVGLYSLQKRAIYPGWWRGTAAVDFDRSAFRQISTRTEDGLRGLLLYAPARADRPVILFFHGNGDSVAGAAVAVASYLAAGYGAVLPEYRGYGGLPGTPTEKGLYRDARAARRWMASVGIGPDRTIVMGYSLGSGVATQSASESRPRALVLIAGFASVARVTAMRFPWIPADWLVTERFDNLAKLGGITSPVLLIHGGADTTVPAANSHLLAASRPGSKLHILSGAGHDIVWQPTAQRLVTDWLGRVNGQPL